MFEFIFAETDLGKDLMAYVFVLAIVVFVLYYLRSKRFDHFHKIELEKQLRRAQEEEHNKTHEDGEENKEEEEVMQHEASGPKEAIISE